MITEIVKNIIRFVILVLLQGLVIKHIPLGPYFIMFPYVMFILMLPFETPNLLLLAGSFALGLSVDMFYDTQGMHASACVLMGFSRVYVLKLIAPREGYDASMKPTVQYMGITWFVSYAFILILIHHITYFYLEAFNVSEFFRTLLRVLASSFASLVFIYIVQFLFYRNDNSRV
ncbi:MAG: rod shape-determining protein MreD [Bacteroidia bacterium]